MAFSHVMVKHAHYAQTPVQACKVKIKSNQNMF